MFSSTLSITPERPLTPKEKRLFNIAGTLFFVAQLVILSSLIFESHTRPFLFWLCNNFCFFLAIACYLRNMQLVKAISYIGLLPQLLWIADFVSDLAGFDLSGVADYIRTEGYTYANDVSIVIHMSIPIAILFFSFKTRPQLPSLIYTLPYIALLYIGTLLFTPPFDDVNCVFYACKLDAYLPYHILAWPLYTLAVTFFGYATHMLLYYGWQNAKEYRKNGWKRLPL